MLLYYITDRRQFAGSGQDQRRALLEKIREAARAGVDYIQLREKDLSARELLRLASEAIDAISNARVERQETRNQKLETRLLVNSRLDVALAAGAAGVHLRADDISATEARAVCAKAASAGHGPLSTDHFVIGVSCHTSDEVRRAQADGADFAVFAPVFEKGGQQGVGLEALRSACRGPGIPVLALGGVTPDNARACMAARAAGIAGIRLFQDNDIAEVVAALRGMPITKDAKQV